MSSSPLNPHPQEAVAGHDAKSGVGSLQHAAGHRPGEQHLIERGYVPVRQLYGKVIGVWGDAHIRHLDGTITVLHVGDVIKKGEVVLTAQDGIVQLEAAHTLLASTAADDVDRVISQVDNGEIDIQPAAGPNSGGAAGSLEEGLRVDRDAESVTPASLDFNPFDTPVPTTQQQAVTPLESPPVANPDSETTATNTPVTFDPRGNDTSTSTLTIVSVAGQPIGPNTPVTLPQGTVTMNADGTLTFTPAPGVTGSVSFTYTEANGSSGTSTSSVTINVVGPADNAPTAVADTFSGHENAVITGNVATNDTPSIDGGNHWTLATGAAHGTVALNADGTFSYSPAANYSGPDSFTYTVTDVDGSTSTATVTLNVAPVPLAADDTIAARQNTPATGNLAANDTPAAGETNVWAVAAAPSHGTVTVNPDGTFSYIPVANYSGPDSFTYTITAADGSQATATARVDVAADPLAAASIGLRHDAQDDTGASPTDSLTGNARPILDGIGQPGSTVTVTVTPAGGSPITYTAPTDSTGHWSIDLATQAPVAGALLAGGLPDGDVALGVSTTNGTGVTTTATSSMVVDSTPPTASIDLQHDTSNDTGNSSTDGVTANPHPVLVGTGEPSSTVTVSVTPTGGSPVTYTVPTDASGHWSIDTGTATPVSGAIPATGLPDGPVGLSVTSTDGAGNTTTATGSFTEDHAAPVASIDLKHDGADDTGASSTDGLTNNAKPVLTGTGEPNGTVTITVTPSTGGPLTYAATTDAAGNWSLDTATATPTSGTLPAAGLPNGLVGLSVTSTDAAGNTTTATGSFTEDHAAPVASIDLKHDGVDDTGASSTDGLTNNAKPVLTGTGEPNGTVTITVTPSAGGPLTYAATTDAAGNWSLDTATATPTSGTLPAAGLPNGPVGLSVTSTDGAGNTTTATGSFTEDHAAPVASIDLQHDGLDDTGTSITDGLTNNAKPVLTGTGEPNGTVTITVTPSTGGPLTYTATTDATGNWSLDTSTASPTSGTLPAAGLPNGLVGLSVTSTDGAGNTTTATGSFTEDHTAPVASIDLQHDGVDDTGASSTDGLTNNAKPVLTGTGEPSSTVTVTVTPSTGGPLTYTATTDAAGNWSLDTATATPTSGTLPAAGLPNGLVGLSVTSTDGAGNTTTATGSFTEDHTAPVASIDLKHDGVDDTGASSTDGLTNNAKPVLTGTGEPNGTVTITVTPSTGGPLTYTATTDAAGNWSLDTATATPTSGTLPGAGLPNGPVSLSVTSTDGAGNTTTATGSFTEDHTAPVASIDLRHDGIDDTGSSSTDGITANTRPIINGTGEPSSTVTVTVTPASGGTLTYTATTNASGAWAIDLATATPTSGTLPAGGLVDGNVALHVTSTDAAGNTASADGAFTVNHTVPLATIDLVHDVADDTGASATDGITRNTSPVIAGTGYPNGVVQVTVTDSAGHVLTYDANTDGTGKWSIDTATAPTTSGVLPVGGFADGTVALQVVTTDTAGNTATATGSFTEDHSAPIAAIDLQHDAADDTGTSITDGLTSNAKPMLTGTGEPNSTVTITVTPTSGGTLTYTATTDNTGKWSLDTAAVTPTTGTMPAAGLPDGAVGLSVTSTDAAGNTATATGSFTEDHTAPIASIDLKHDAIDDTGASVTDGLTSNAKPILTGTGEANSTVTITVTPTSGGALTYTATTDATGAWSLNTATATPTSGTMPAAGLPDGSVGLSVTTTDAAGNTTTATGSFVEDHTAPAATIGLQHDALDDTGASATDSVTANVKPVLTGTGEANGTVTITVTPTSGGALTYTAATDASGHWAVDTATATPTSGTMPAAGLPDGNVALKVVSTDAAGNTATGTGTFLEDHTAPAATIGLKHDALDDTGASATDSVTANARPILVGTGEANSTVSITVTPSTGGALTYTATTDGGGNWSLDTATAVPTSGTLPAAGLPDGTIGLSVTTTDAAGNSATGTGSFTEVHSGPAATIDLRHDAADDTGVSSTDGITDNSKPILNGVGAPSSTVTITVTPSNGGALTYTATTDASGNWTLDTATATPTSGTMPLAGLPDGTVGLKVVTTDAAGNTATGTGSFLEDHTAPAAAIGLKHDALDDTGVSATDNITANAKPVLTGTGEANSVVSITVTPATGGAVTYTAATNAAGQWSLDLSAATPTSGTLPAAGLPNGTVGLSVTTIDIAGNSASATSSFLEDHTAPVAAIGLKHDALDDTGVSATDNLTANAKPILVGTGEANSTVTVTVTPATGGAITYTATTDATGAWSLNTATATPTSGILPAAGLPNGNVGLSVTSTDVAGNTATATSSFVEDHTAPVATIGLQHAAADDTGISATDSITANAKPILVGTGEANSTVTITVSPASGGALTYTATTDASGAWSLNTATATPTSGTMPAAGLPDGNVGLSVTSTDAAGNSATGTGTFLEDHTAPAAAIGLQHDATNDTGVSATDNVTANVKPVIVGTGEANSTVTITLSPASGGSVTYTAATDNTGAWSLDLATATPTSGTLPAAGLVDGNVGLSVVTTDAAGNSATATSTFLEDHSAPTAAIGLKHDGLDDTGASATDSITANVKPILVGLGEANSTVTITVTPASGGALTYTTTTDASGNWSLDTNTAIPVTGTLPATGLVDGVVNLTVATTDVAGNTATATSSFLEDHTAPAATIGLKHDALDDTGVSTTDSITANAKPILTGTGEANSTVTITVTPTSGGAITYTATTNAAGAWSLDLSTATQTSGTLPATGLPDGNVALKVVTTDVAGNTATGTGTFLEDHTPPAATIGLKHDALDDTGVSSTDNITANAKPILTGTGEANSIVTITVTPTSGGAITYTATTDATGAWSLNTATATPTSGTMPAAGLPDGNVGLSVTTTDAAGNSATGTSTFLEDHTAPAATIGLKHDAADDTGVSATDNITANAKPILVGTGEANSTVTITVTPASGGALTYTATTDAAGAWSLNTATATPTSGTMPAAGLPNGNVGLSVTTTDAAGNSATGTSTFLEDHTAPAATISLKHDALDDTGVSSTDNITANVKPILVGTGEPNSTVTITVTPATGGAITFTATTNAAGAWSLDLLTATPIAGNMPAAGLPDGNVGLKVVTTDVAGNTATGTGTFLEDHTAPAATIGLKHDAADDTGISATDNVTANAKPILTGTGEANSTVAITVTPASGGALTYTATTDATGAWSLNTATATPTSGTLPATGLADGNVTLKVVTTDTAGNTATGTSTFLEDHTAPAATIGLKHDALDDTGASSTDSITANAKPILTGTGEANSTVTITVTPASGGVLTYVATTDATGAWSLNTATATPTSGTLPAAGLPDGNVGLSVTTTDAAGNTATGTSTFLEDHTAPTASIDLKHDAADDTGASSTDGITSNAKPILTGTGEANATVNVTVTDSAGHVLTYTATTDAGGAWSLNTAIATPTSGTMPAAGLADGTVSLQVVTTDAAGNSASATGSFTEVHSGPVATIDLKHDAADDTGASSTDGITSNAKPILTGIGSPSSTVQITVTPATGGALTYTATTDATGAWSLNTATAAPTTGTMPAAGLADGNVTLKVVTTDGAGNAATGTGTFLEDHTAPAATIGLKHDALDDTGVSTTDSITANVKPILTGTGEANSTVTITVTPAAGGALTYTATTDATGAWSLNTATATPTSGTMPAAGLPDGNVTLKVVTTDAAGNTATGTGTFLEDHTAPAATIGLKHDAADDTGVSATDNLTANAKPILTGTGEANSTVTITVTPTSGGAITYAATTDATGAWSLNTATATPTSGALPAAGLPDGNVGLSVTTTDAAGNSATGTSSFVEDHTGPAAVIGLKHDALDDTGASSTDNITANVKPILVGTGEANSTVTITVTPASGGALTYTATTDASGAWSLDTATATPTSGTMPAAGLPDGNVTLKVVTTDAAGNTATGTGTFLEDHTAPAATIGLKHDAADDTGVSATDNLTANAKPILTGTGEANSTVTITVTPTSGGAITYTATTDATGAWSLNTATATPTSGTMPAAGLPDGNVGLSVTTTDAAGNSATGTSSFVEDHTAPAAVIGLKHDALDDTGASSTDSITANVKPILVGTGEPSSTVTITVTPASGGALTYTATTDATGAWSLNTATATPTSGTMPAAGLADGNVTLKVVTTDAAGNTATGTGTFLEDHTGPAATIGLKHDALDDTGASSTDSITANAKPILTGTGEANSTVTITVTPTSGGAITYTATTDASGAWSLNTATATPTSGTMPVAGLPDGSVGLSVTTTDAAGNSATGTGSFVEDHTVPAATIGLKHDAADDTGVSATDNITANVKPILTGTGEPSSTVVITVTPATGGAVTYSATTNAAGAWSLDLSTATPTSGTLPAAGLVDGTVGLKVVTTDVAGNSATGTSAFLEDHTAPVATIGLKHDALDDTGASSTDSITANVKPILTGTGEPGSTVTITVTPASGGVLTYTATTDATGAWSLSTATATPTSGTMPAAGLPDGNVTLKVVTTDAAGNTATGTGTFLEDHTAPTASIGLKHDAADDTGVSTTDNLTANTKPILTGTGEPSSTVIITVTPTSGGVLTYTATTDATGAWSLNTATATPTSGTMPAAGLPDGNVGLSVTTTDAAGNSATGTSSFVEDHTAPAATIGLKHDAADDTGVSTTDNITANAKPILTGTGEPSSTVTITVTPASGGVLTYTATTDATGAWSLNTATATPTSGTMPAAGLPDGNVGLSVTTTDAAGNTATGTSTFLEDHTAPAATIGLKHDAADDTGASTTDNITANVKPILTGTGEPSSTVVVTVTPASGGAITYNATTNAAGAWSLDLSTATPTSGTLPAAGLVDGTVGLKVVTTDAAGNSATGTSAFLEDHTAPAATIGLKHDAADDTGVSTTDNVTANVKPILVGTGEPSSVVTITVTPASGGALTYTATTDASGAWSLNMATATPTSGTMPAAGLPDGNVTLKVVTTDAAGNTATGTSAFLEDHTAPAATIGLKHDAANDTGTLATDSITGNATPILVGTGEPSSTVTITVTPASGGVLTYTATTDATGAWSLNTATATPTSGTMPAAGLADGTVGLKVVTTDAAGNSATGTGSFVEDHAQAPTLTVTGKTFYAATDFDEVTLPGGYGNVLASILGSGAGSTTTSHAGTWQTTNGGSTVEIGTGSTYGALNANGTANTSHVIELEQNPNDTSNLFTTMTTKAGEVYNLSFDYAARGGSLATSIIYVYWEGQLVGSLNTQSATMTHVNLQLISTTNGTGKLEFVAGDSNSFGGVLDNITLGLAQDTGVQGYLVNLPVLATALVSADGTDTLKVTIDALPVGAVLSDGTHTFTATTGSTVADVTGWTLSSLVLTPPAAFKGDLTLGVHSVDTQADTGTTAHSDTTVTLHVQDDTAGVYGTAANDTLTITDASAAASAIRWGLDGNDSITGSIGHDTLMGGAGNDTLRAGSGATLLDGGIGNDSLVAGVGSDTLSGGQGNDTMTAGTSAVTDVFKWHLGDGGSEGTTAGHAAVDTIIGFDSGKASAGGDILDLRDLLVGELAGGTGSTGLTHFLDFDTTSTAGSTIIHISTHGDFASGYAAANEDQTIVLQGVDLRASMGLASTATDATVISELINRGKLITDGQ